jgi:hypothetical protein
MVSSCPSTFAHASIGAIHVDPQIPANVVAVMSRGYSGRLNDRTTGPADWPVFSDTRILNIFPDNSVT